MFLQQFIISLDKDFLWIFFVIYNSRNLDISYYNLKIIKDRIYNSRNLDIIDTHQAILELMELIYNSRNLDISLTDNSQ